MRAHANKFNDTQSIEDAWWNELELFEYDVDDIDTASCAELADELAVFEIQANSDPNFENSLCDWHGYIIDEMLWLGLEQSCYEGVLLPIEQIHLRLKTSPQSLRDTLWYFFWSLPHACQALHCSSVLVDGANRQSTSHRKSRLASIASH